MWFVQIQRNTTQPSVKSVSRYVMLNSNIVNIGHALSSNNTCVNSQVTLKAAQLFKSQMSSLCMCESWYFNYVVCGALCCRNCVDEWGPRFQSASESI